MKEQAITNMVEGLVELHVEYLKTGEGASLIACLSEKENMWEGDWKILAAAEARLMMAVCKRIAEALNEDD